MRTLAHGVDARLPSPLMELSALDITIIVAFFAISLGIGLVGVLLALLHRIRVEERVLAAAFGDAWTAHCARTWRLVPFVW
jgi:protein-S-isoprenylcysteine O-methyltransferase Ste14